MKTSELKNILKNFVGNTIVEEGLETSYVETKDGEWGFDMVVEDGVFKLVPNKSDDHPFWTPVVDVLRFIENLEDMETNIEEVEESEADIAELIFHIN